MITTGKITPNYNEMLTFKIFCDSEEEVIERKVLTLFDILAKAGGL